MLFLLLSLNLWAQKTVVQSETSSDIEYEQYLLENPQKKPFIASLEKNLSKNKMSNELLTLLKKAQYEFINGSIEESKNKFKDIFELRHQADWNLNERKTIHYSMFRLAQLEKDSKKSEFYIYESIIFDKNLEPDKNLFPPPLVALFHKTQLQQRNKIWPLPKNSEEFSAILVNGELVESKQSFLQTIDGTKRFSFLSNKYEPIHIITDVKKLALHKLILKPLVSGNCENPQFSEFLKNEDYLGFFHPQCVLPSHLSSSFTQLSAQQLDQPTHTIEKKWDTKNIWTWVGLTALTAVVTWKVLENRQKSPQSNAPSSQPTKTHISNGGASH